MNRFVSARYKAYKKSKIEYIGDIPEHWRLLRMQDLKSPKKNSFVDGPFGSDLKNEEYVDEADSTIPIVQLNNISPGLHNLENLKFVTQDKARSLSRHLVEANDLLIAKMAEPVARCAIASSAYKNYVVSADCIKLTVAPDYLPKYIEYWLNSSVCRGIAELNATGTTRLRVNLGVVKKLPIPMPSLDEQRKIVDFLDLEVGLINQMINKQEKLIEYSEERRKSIISYAITKGVDSHATMKASSIDWLGEYPAHWSFKRLKYSLSINPSASEVPDTTPEKLIPFFPMEAIGDDGSLIREFERPFSEISGGYTYFRNGDVVIAKVTPCFENGKGALIHDLDPGFGFGTTELVVLRPGVNLNNQYLYYISISQEIRLRGVAYMTGAGGLKRVPDSFYTDLVWPLPPIHEQLAIVNYLDEELNKADLLIKKATQSIVLLQEYRSSIISSVVTGKVDVGLI